MPEQLVLMRNGVGNVLEMNVAKRALSVLDSRSSNKTANSFRRPLPGRMGGVNKLLSGGVGRETSSDEDPGIPRRSVGAALLRLGRWEPGVFHDILSRVRDMSSAMLSTGEDRGTPGSVEDVPLSLSAASTYSQQHQSS